MNYPGLENNTGQKMDQQQYLRLSGTMMKNDELHISLISGEFEPSGAADVLLSMINDKIRYHTVKSLKPDEEIDLESASSHRINELKEAKSKTIYEVQQAFKNGYQLEIEGTIVIRRKARDKSLTS